MKLLTAAMGLCIAALLPACAGVEPVTNLQERISGRGYSFLPPQEQGWHIMGQSAEGIDMLRKGDSVDETHGIQIRIMEMPDTSLPALAYVMLTQSQQYPGPRFERLESRRIDAPLRKNCEKYTSIHRDRDAGKASDNPEDMLIKDYEQFCVHPHDKAHLILVHYSRRYYPAHEDPEFERKALDFIQSVSFDPF